MLSSTHLAARVARWHQLWHLIVIVTGQVTKMLLGQLDQFVVIDTSGPCQYNPVTLVMSLDVVLQVLASYRPDIHTFVTFSHHHAQGFETQQLTS